MALTPVSFGYCLFSEADGATSWDSGGTRCGLDNFKLDGPVGMEIVEPEELFTGELYYLEAPRARSILRLAHGAVANDLRLGVLLLERELLLPRWKEIFLSPYGHALTYLQLSWSRITWLVRPGTLVHTDVTIMIRIGLEITYSKLSVTVWA